jgi:Acetyltransferase (GNAT) domain
MMNDYGSDQGRITIQGAQPPGPAGGGARAQPNCPVAGTPDARILGYPEAFALAAHLGTAERIPATARLPWQLAALASAKGAQALLVAVPGACGGLDGYVLLRYHHRGVLRLTNPRPRSDDAWTVTARSARAARATAAALAATLHAARTPWQVELTGLDISCARLLARTLPHAEISPAPGVPYLRLDASLSASLSADTRRSLRRSARRLAEDGIAASVRFDSQPGAVLALRDEIEQAHRTRDQASGRTSDLDDPDGLAFWRTAYNCHAQRGEIEVATLRISSELAAYSVAICDPPAYRVWDSRMCPRWARYAPGRQLETAVLGRALASPLYTHLDWMSSGHPEALIAASGLQPRWKLTAGMP